MWEIDCSDLNALILAPCQLKVPMERLLAGRARAISAETGEALRWRLVSNATLQENVFKAISRIETAGELPDIMIAPGIGHFFYEIFTQRFRNAHTVAAHGAMSPDFEALGLADPKRLLVKKQVSPAVHAFADVLTGSKMGRIFAQAGFFPLQGTAADVSEYRSYDWCGWDFIGRYDMYALLPACQKLYSCLRHQQPDGRAHAAQGRADAQDGHLVTITKGDVVSQAKREVFAFHVRKANPGAVILQINGIT